MPQKNRKAATPRRGSQQPESSAVSEHGYLESIDRLLDAAFDLMKREPAIDKVAFEQLRQLRVRVRYALSSREIADDDAPPKVAPSLFKDRQDKAEGPISFAARTYLKWLGKNIFRSDIKRLDPQLYNSLYNLEKSDQEMAKIGLLTKKQLNDLKLKSFVQIEKPSTTLRIAELPPSERERARLFNLIRRRKQRSSTQ